MEEDTDLLQFLPCCHENNTLEITFEEYASPRFHAEVVGFDCRREDRLSRLCTRGATLKKVDEERILNSFSYVSRSSKHRVQKEPLREKGDIGCL